MVCFLEDVFFVCDVWLNRGLFFFKKLVVKESVCSEDLGKLFGGLLGEGRLGDLIRGGIGGRFLFLVSFGKEWGGWCGGGNLLRDGIYGG